MDINQQFFNETLFQIDESDFEFVNFLTECINDDITTATNLSTINVKCNTVVQNANEHEIICTNKVPEKPNKKARRENTQSKKTYLQSKPIDCVSLNANQSPIIDIVPYIKTPGLSFYHKCTVEDLRKLARRLGVKYSKKRKAELISMLEEKENFNPCKT